MALVEYLVYTRYGSKTTVNIVFLRTMIDSVLAGEIVQFRLCRERVIALTSSVLNEKRQRLTKIAIEH